MITAILKATASMAAEGFAWLLYRHRGPSKADQRLMLLRLLDGRELDGGHLLSITTLDRDTIAARMSELERAGLVHWVPSMMDPFWRDRWRLTEAGKMRARGVS